MRIYHWNPTDRTVTVVVSGHPRPLDHVLRYSPEFSCGTTNVGALDLSLSILYDLVGPHEADLWHGTFAVEVIAHLSPESHWRLTDEQIKYRLAAIRERARNREASACERKVGVA